MGDVVLTKKLCMDQNSVILCLYYQDGLNFIAINTESDLLRPFVAHFNVHYEIVVVYAENEATYVPPILVLLFFRLGISFRRR